jgi:hypothetical protein
MNVALTDLATAAGARIVLPARGGESARVECVILSDKISELLHHGAPGTVLVTGLANHHLLRAAGLVEATAICLTGGREPSAELLDAARGHGVTLMVAPGTPAETAEAMRRVLAEGGRGRKDGGPGTGDRGPGRWTATVTAEGGCATRGGEGGDA